MLQSLAACILILVRQCVRPLPTSPISVVTNCIRIPCRVRPDPGWAVSHQLYTYPVLQLAPGWAVRTLHLHHHDRDEPQRGGDCKARQHPGGADGHDGLDK